MYVSSTASLRLFPCSFPYPFEPCSNILPPIKTLSSMSDQKKCSLASGADGEVQDPPRVRQWARRADKSFQRNLNRAQYRREKQQKQREREQEQMKISKEASRPGQSASDPDVQPSGYHEQALRSPPVRYYSRSSYYEPRSSPDTSPPRKQANKPPCMSRSR